MKKLTSFLALCFGLAPIFAQSVVDVIVASPSHTILEEAVITAGLDDDLASLSSATVFAPDDDAFAALLDELELTKAELLASDDLEEILLYHVLGTEVTSDMLVNASYATTLSGDSVIVTLPTDGGVFIDHAEVDATLYDIEGGNGVIHSLKSVLLPGNTIVDLAIQNEFTILTQAVVTAELVPVLTNPTAEFTVFAPTDAAFVGLLGELNITAEELLADEDLDEILLYHVLGSSVLAADLENAIFATTAQGDSVFVSVGVDDVKIDQATVILEDVLADNGVVHAIDDVLLPGQSIVDVAIQNDFSILTEAVVTAGLAPALIDPLAVLTVFAPTDDAFVDLLGELNITAEELLADEDLADILLYHVVGAEVYEADLEDAIYVETLNGDSLIVSLLTDGAFIDQAPVALTDVMADNGVVHVIDEVILPQNTIVDVAVSNGFEILTNAVIEAELVPALVDPFAGLTVFAPTDDAFVGLLGELNITAEELLADEDLADILLYHVVGAEVYEADLEDAIYVETLNGDSLIVSLLADGAFIDQAPVSLTDVTADNGVVHVIDEVILPQNTIVDVAVSNGFEILTNAVIEAELVPALVDPFAGLTVFAPTDDAFVDYITEEGITAEDLLAAPNLKDILLYHVLGNEVISDNLMEGDVETLFGDNVTISLTGGVFVNDAEVILEDVDADNGIVHVIDAVLVPTSVTTSVSELSSGLTVYPNPTSDYLFVDGSVISTDVFTAEGKLIISSEDSKIDLSGVEAGIYTVNVKTEEGNTVQSIIVE